jgi:fibrillarin-like pre-rRNA processing protein
VEATPWPGVRRESGELFTPNLDPGHRVYGEALRTVGGVEYRAWDPFRSKLAALLRKGAPNDLLAAVNSALYLGAAHGTTVSHVSDLWPDGTIFAVEKSPASFAPLLALARRRANVLPLLADAQLPERYRADVGEVGFLYQDVAQRDQARIFVDNADACLVDGGRGVLMLKVRSVTQRRSSAAVAQEARTELRRGGLSIVGETPLAPFSKDHLAFVIRR